MDIVVIGPTIRFAKTLLHDCYIFLRISITVGV